MMFAKVVNPESPRHNQVGEIKGVDTYHTDNGDLIMYHIRFTDTPHWGVFGETEVELDPKGVGGVN